MEVWEYQNDTFTDISNWVKAGDNKIRIMEKFLCVNDKNLSVTLSDNTLRLKIDASWYLFLRKNRYAQIGYTSIGTCDLSISGDNVISFSDAEGRYEPCTYGDNAYLVVTDRNNTNEDDLVVGVVAGSIYSNYPAIMAAFYRSLINGEVKAKIELLDKEFSEVNNTVNNLSVEISDLKINDWDWEDMTSQAVNTLGVVIPTALTASGYISFRLYSTGNTNVIVSLYSKNNSGEFVKEKDLATFNVDKIKTINEFSLAEKVDITGHEYYLGLSSGNVGYINTANPDGEFRLLANNGIYYGLCLTFSIRGELPNSVGELQNQVVQINEDIADINDQIESLTNADTELAETENWVKVQGNIFNQEEFVLKGATISDNSILLDAPDEYAALDKMYWSNRRIHKFSITPKTLGVLVVNMAQNTSNAMYPKFIGGNWTSRFKIDFVGKKIYMGDDIAFDITMNLVAGKKYIIELKYVKRIFTVTITDFLTMESCTVTLDARDSNKNGGFKNTLVIMNESGNYSIERIETYEVANAKLVLFGDSITEAIGRVGMGENYSEIISEKVRSCTIIAQGGAGAGSWDEIFENEIKFIKPQYCSFHMGVNGGVIPAQLEKFVSDCESIGTIPIINHVICTGAYNIENTNDTWNAIIDEFVSENGYLGYLGDVATAEKYDVSTKPNYIATSIEGGTKWGIKKMSMALECFATRTLSAGTTVVENEIERQLDSPLTVIVDIHPNAEGHAKMAERYLKEVSLI